MSFANASRIALIALSIAAVSQVHAGTYSMPASGGDGFNYTSFDSYGNPIYTPVPDPTSITFSLTVESGTVTYFSIEGGGSPLWPGFQTDGLSPISVSVGFGGIDLYGVNVLLNSYALVTLSVPDLTDASLAALANFGSNHIVGSFQFSAPEFLPSDTVFGTGFGEIGLAAPEPSSFALLSISIGTKHCQSPAHCAVGKKEKAKFGDYPLVSLLIEVMRPRQSDTDYQTSTLVAWFRIGDQAAIASG